MGRPVVQAILALLLTLAFSQSSKGEANDVKQIDLTKQSDEIQASVMENSVFRVARDAGRRSQSSRKGNNLNKKKPNKERKKLRNAKKNGTKNKKMGRSRKNRMKLKNKGKKNGKQLRKTKKKRTKKWKKSRTNKNKPKKEQNKKKSGQRQKSKLLKEKKKKNELSKWEPKAACDEAVLCQKIKDYIKISNQLRKVRRIIKSCDTMDRKANKSASEFEETVTALETAIGSSSGRRMYRSRWRRAREADDDVTSIKDKLKNCSITAKAKCQKSSVAPCQEEANLTKCENELHGWLTKFGPSIGSCLQASSDCCACITALPDVSKDCLAFDKKSTMAVDSKKKCTGGDEEGSFGFCKKLQIEAAEKGPKHAKDKCKPSGGMTTKGPTGVANEVFSVYMLSLLDQNGVTIDITGVIQTSCGTKDYTRENKITRHFNGENCEVERITAYYLLNNQQHHCEEFGTTTKHTDFTVVASVGRYPCKVEKEE